MNVVKTALVSLALAFTLGACSGGDNKPPPNNPDPEPNGCCQFDARCVQADDANACTNRGGEFLESATCVENQCQ